MVEFALVAPLLFALLLGVFTTGLALAQKNSMSSATREGARLGATLPSSATWADDTRTRVVSLSDGDVSASQVCVRLVTSSNVSVRASSCSLPASDEPAVPAGVVSGDCVVKVWSRRTSDIEAVFFTRTVSLTTSAVSIYERGRGATCTT